MSLASASIGCLAVCLAWAAGPYEYSDEPLKQKPFMTLAEVVVDVTRFNNWLGESYATIPKDKYVGPREHAYLVIDSVLKWQREEGRSSFTDFERFALKTLFKWATQFGVYGAGLAGQHFANGADEPLAESLLPPDPFELQLDFPYFFVSSREAPWRLQLPYYFMIWEIKRFTAQNGLVTDMVIASTSFASHKKGGDRSQATLMFIFSPAADCVIFDESWLKQLGIEVTDKSAQSPLPRSSNYAAYDREQRMRREVTFVEGKTQCTAVALLGVDGTFQANRVSYLDFMKSLSLTPETSNHGLSPAAGPVTGLAEAARPAPVPSAG